MSQRSRTAFTLIELLIVIVIIGILAAIVVPRFAARRDAERGESLRTELERVVTAQEGYFAQHQRYAADLGALGIQPPAGTAITIGGAGITDGTGWSATATAQGGGRSSTCHVGVGRDTVVAGLTLRPAAVTCR